MNIQKNVIVETRSGKLEGVLMRNLHVFKGIPYAAPPVGEFRWLPPQPVKPWSNIRPAKAYQAIAPQIVLPFPGNIGRPEPQNEDCLFLNVFSPGLDNARRPVMVWIHGGAFCAGSGSMAMYSRSTLPTKGDIVLVTINYRLGFLGFLNLKEPTRGRIPSTGNEGLLDQIAALMWVKDNIVAFGGDPDNVTIFGESAGAMSVGCLLTMRETGGLFHRAILQSAAGELVHPLEKSLEITEEFLKIVNVRSDDILALKSLLPEQLLKAQREVARKLRMTFSFFSPVADGDVVPRMPLELLEGGFGHKVPTLAGSNLDEDKVFMMMDPRYHNLDEEGMRKSLSNHMAAGSVSLVINAYREERAIRGESIAPFEICTAVRTDLAFRKTAIRIAESQCKYASGGYNYVFCWKSRAAHGRWGACHGLDIGFVFGNHHVFGEERGDLAHKLSTGMQDAWISFARTGNPSCRSLGDWPQYNDRKTSMIFDEQSHVEKGFREREREIIWKILN
jgi:para-nitrobenzyl esterase